MFKKVLFKSAIALVLILLTYLVGLGAMTVIKTSIEKSEIAECMKLERYSRDYSENLVRGEDGELMPLFYITKLQSEMCTAHGFTINARIQ